MATNAAENRSSWAAVVSAVAGVGAVVVAFLAWGGGSDDGANVPTTATSGSTAETTVDDPEPSTLTVELVSVANPATVSNDLGYSGTPVAIEIRVTAGTDGDGNRFGTPVVAVDQDGRQIESEVDPTYSGSFDLPGVAVPAGESRVGVLLFDVADESDTLTLKITDQAELDVSVDG